MKILKADIPSDYPITDGLSSINMDRLAQLVILVGPNGSGKTRLLNKINAVLKDQPLAQDITQKSNELDNLRIRLNNIEKTLRNLGVTGESKQVNRQILGLQSEKSKLMNAIQDVESVLYKDRLKLISDQGNRNVVHFMPKLLDLKDPNSLSTNEIEMRSKRSHKLGIDNLHEDALAKIQDLHTRFWNATHQDSKLQGSEKKAIQDEYNRLNIIVNSLLGTSMENDSRGKATLFKLPVGQARLSDGQKVLLQLAVAIHSQGTLLPEAVLLLDEPENHLHPSSIIDVLETLIQHIPNGQIWIATHSVSVLAHFYESCSLWYMDQGKLSSSGKIQEKVLAGLLGDAGRIRKQRDFLDKPEKVALIKYVQQCLIPPTTVMTEKNDPQVNQIQNTLNALYAKYGQLKVLDYGAGQGRLLSNLAEDYGSTDDVTSVINYIAYDFSTVDMDMCQSQISKVYESATDRWFGSYANLLASHNKESFQLIVMCNVLHEISPTNWFHLFGPAGELTELLSEDGQLLIVEDQRLPVGENAHEYGFIVMDTGALKDLFIVRGTDAPIVVDIQREGRLKAHLIPKEYMKRVSTKTILNALESHKKHAENEVKRIRKEGQSENGRVFAFWLIQYANAIMALDNSLKA